MSRLISSFHSTQFLEGLITLITILSEILTKSSTELQKNHQNQYTTITQIYSLNKKWGSAQNQKREGDGRGKRMSLPCLQPFVHRPLRPITGPREGKNEIHFKNAWWLCQSFIEKTKFRTSIGLTKPCFLKILLQIFGIFRFSSYLCNQVSPIRR